MNRQHFAIAPASRRDMSWCSAASRCGRGDDVGKWAIRKVMIDSHADILGLSDVLIDCVAGGASVSFMWPMTQQKAQNFWRDSLLGAAQGDRVVLVAEDAQGIAGTVTVMLNQPENQP